MTLAKSTSTFSVALVEALSILSWRLWLITSASRLGKLTLNLHFSRAELTLAEPLMAVEQTLAKLELSSTQRIALASLRQLKVRSKRRCLVRR